MTPSLESLYEPLIVFASEHLSAFVAQMRLEFSGVIAFATNDAWYEETIAAFWDRALCDPRMVHAARDANVPQNMAEMLDRLARAQRGLFHVEADSDGASLECIVSGAHFRLSPQGSFRWIDAGLLDAHVVPTLEGVAVLPGVLVHEASARECVERVVARAQALAMPQNTLLDALLTMRHRLVVAGRLKPHHAYRPELLDVIRGPGASNRP
jgi:hypothetical protein